MSAKKINQTKRVTRQTLSRRQQIKEEIYSILKTEAHDWFSFIESRDNTLTKRLNSIEANGIPDGVLEEIKKNIHQLRFSLRRTTAAMESLLNFFNISKEFLTQQLPESTDKNETN